MPKIAIVGSGFIGRAWAISFARAGHAVALWDAQAGAVDHALGYIDMLLPDLASQNLLRGAGVGEVRRRMRAASASSTASAHSSARITTAWCRTIDFGSG